MSAIDDLRSAHERSQRLSTPSTLAALDSAVSAALEEAERLRRQRDALLLFHHRVRGSGNARLNRRQLEAFDAAFVEVGKMRPDEYCDALGLVDNAGKAVRQ